MNFHPSFAPPFFAIAAIPVISAVMGEDWVTASDGQEIRMDDFVDDLIELEARQSVWGKCREI